MLLVSAIVPAYNGERFLAEALDSALGQVGRTFEVEVLVVDDGSIDRTQAIAEHHAERHPGRVRLLRQQRRGPASARNLGVRHAEGEWLAFLDCDDTWLPGKLERQLAMARPGTGLVYTDRQSFGRGREGRRLSDEVVLPRGDVFEQLLCNNFVTASSVLMRRDVFERLGGFCEYIYGAEDWDLWLRYAHESPVELCPEALTRYRRHAASISSDPCALFLAQCKVLARALALPRGREVDRDALRLAIAGGAADLRAAQDAATARGKPSSAAWTACTAIGEHMLAAPLRVGRGAARAMRERARALCWPAWTPAVPPRPSRGAAAGAGRSWAQEPG